jgi:hypothetical protein
MSYESSEEYYITISQQDVRNSEISLQSQLNINDAEITEELSPHKNRMKRLNSYLKKRDLARLERIYQSEARIIPYKEFSYILSIYILFGAFSIVNSDRAWLWEMGIEKCTRSHIYLLVLFIGFVGVLVYFIVKGINSKTKMKDSLGYYWEERDFKMKYKNMSVICVVSVIAGICAGMLGMSGGTFLSPLLLSYRIRPEITAATSSFLLFFTSSISTLQFLYIKQLQTSLALILLLSSVVGSLLGITVVNKFIEKHKRASLLVILISIFLTISSISMLIYAFDSISSVSLQSLPLSNSSFCN